MITVPTLDFQTVALHASVLLEHTLWPRKQLLAYQHGRLQAVLRQAVEKSPFYRTRIGALVEHNAPLSAFPTLTKSDLMANFDTIVSDHQLTRKLIEDYLSGADANTPLLGAYRAIATGGTLGEAGLLVYDEAGWLSVIANFVRFQRMLGVNPGTRSVGIGAPSPRHFSNRLHAELRTARPGSPSLEVTMPIEVVVTALNSYQPEVITTYPSFIRVLAAEQQAGRLAIAPRFFRSGAEALTAEVKELVWDVWSIPVYNGYSSTEVGAMAQECMHARGMHLAEDLAVYEVVDERNDPVPCGQPGAKVLVTPLNNAALPLIRYELSDVVVLDDAPCPCGCSFMRIAAMEGRREDVLRFPLTRGGFVDIHALRLRTQLISAAEIQQLQMVRLHDDGLAITIALRPGADAAAASAQVDRRLRALLAAHDAQIGKLEVNVVGQIPRIGSGAKERIVMARQ